MKKSLIVLIIIGAIVVVSVVYYFQNNRLISCTKEAMACPNGRGVGRVGPNCEFAPCELPSNLDECESKEGFWKDWCYRDYATAVVSEQAISESTGVCNMIKRNYLKEECLLLLGYNSK